ncbi:alpha/beta hydrolase [Gemmata sp. JC673]|uniref:Alpha/beta hydrolase n=1 Tax=Gemmata algarum TaxID=2975278 RepID=A0ABU5F6U5_9BACT|nr:alpha/beta hydrolase [Gemmata algarum]MDY3561599.1 alpha/beta hydrolase [Gemmata algarum]
MNLLSLLVAVGVAAPAEGKPEAHEKHADIAYRTDKDADKERHVLDVYTPKGKKDFPTVLFVHGGSWKSGNKNLYEVLGKSLAADGIGCVICNYRLSPKVQHPAHIEDVAKAFAWTRDNIGKYGGKKDQLFLCGHSAGGHLVSLLATDPQYLKAERCSAADIRGVASLSGVYKILHTERVFEVPFGKDEKVCTLASPLAHATGKCPPFFIAYADADFPLLDKMAEDMGAALKKAGSPFELMKCKDRDHYTIIVQFVSNADPLNKSFREFVQKNSK